MTRASTEQSLHAGTRGRTASIKQVLLAGQVVVGVGNIYASEALFRAGIHPATRAARLGRMRCERLALAVREVLNDAIGVGRQHPARFLLGGRR